MGTPFAIKIVKFDILGTPFSEKYVEALNIKLMSSTFNTPHEAHIKTLPFTAHKEKKHRRDGMSRLGTSRNVQWSAEGVTNSLCSRAHNLVNLSNLR